MSADLKRSFDAFPKPDVSPEPEALWERARRRGWMRKALAVTGVVCVSVVLWSVVPGALERKQDAPVPPRDDRERVDRGWKDASDEPIATGGYVFSNLQVRLAPQVDPSATLDRAVIRGDIGFVDGYPGKKVCTWEVVDADGDVIGSATSEFMAAGPSSGMIKDRVDVGGEPESVRVFCGDERLDDPQGHFEFGAAKIETTADGDDRENLTVRAPATWIGQGDPTPQRCLVSLLDESGQVLMEEERGYTSVGRKPKNAVFRIQAARSVRQRAVDAQIECSGIG